LRFRSARRRVQPYARTVKGMNNAIGLASGLAVAVVVLVLGWLAGSGRLDRWSDRRACAVLAVGAVVIIVGAVGLWATLPFGWRPI
jgi:hypothetical protein